MPAGISPYPYHYLINGIGYLKPPQDVMVNFRDFYLSNKAVDWFPDRVQSGSLSERLFPQKDETAFTVKDRSGGFGYTDWPEEIGDNDPGVYAWTDAVDAGSAGDGQGADCSVEGIAFLAPFLGQTGLPLGNGPMSGHFELTLSGTRYAFVVMGTQLYQSSDGDSWSNLIPGTATPMPQLAATLTGRPVVFRGTQAGDRVYFPLGQGTLTQMWDGVAVAFTSLGVADNNKWIDAIRIDDALWALWYDTGSKFYRLNKTQDGGAAPTWGASYSVTDGADPAQYLLYGAGKLFVGCRTHMRQTADDLGSMGQTLFNTRDAAATNFKYWAQFGPELWFNAGGGTWRLVPTGNGTTLALSQVGPETKPSNRTPVVGNVTAKASDDFCLYEFIQNPSGVTYLLKHRYYDNRRREATHCLERIGTYSVQYAFVTTVGDGPRLVFGLTNTSAGVIVLPKNGYYPPGDPRCKFCAKGAIIESRQYGGMTFIPKVLLAWTGRTQDTSSTETVTPYYRVAGQTPYTAYNSNGAISADPGSRVQLASPVTALSWWENEIVLQRGGTLTLTPKLLAGTSGFNLRPPGKGTFAFYVWVADYSATRAQQRDWRSAVDVQADILALRDNQGIPVTFVDDLGGSFQVIVNDVNLYSVELSADENPERVARITATEWNTVLRGTWESLSRFTWGDLSTITWGEAVNK